MMASVKPTAKTDTPATLEELMAQIEALRAEIASVASTAGDVVVDGVQAAGRKLVRTGRNTRASVVDAIAEHPLAAVGIAAGIGFVVGLLVRR